MIERLPILAIKGYQCAVSPVLSALAAPGCGCRFSPSCSHYAIEALSRHGLMTGSALAAQRLLRCHPFHPGGVDPVP